MNKNDVWDIVNKSYIFDTLNKDRYPHPYEVEPRIDFWEGWVFDRSYEVNPNF